MLLSVYLCIQSCLATSHSLSNVTFQCHVNNEPKDCRQKSAHAMGLSLKSHFGGSGNLSEWHHMVLGAAANEWNLCKLGQGPVNQRLLLCVIGPLLHIHSFFPSLALPLCTALESALEASFWTGSMCCGQKRAGRKVSLH